MFLKTSPKIERWLSFDAWDEDGFRIIKGEKSRLRSPNGTPLFNEQQVEEDIGVYEGDIETFGDTD